MRIDCVAAFTEAHTLDLRGKTAVVIDALRATSSITAALAAGAAAVVPAETIEEARQLASGGGVLAGERKGLKIPGFALGNSPAEFRPETVGGQRIVMTTTNGTKAIRRAAHASGVLAGSFLNAAACAAAAAGFGRDIVLICAGTKRGFALEDGLCAGLIAGCVRALAHDRITAIGDFALAMEAAYEAAARRLEETMLSCEGGKRLSALGCSDDVAFCAAVDQYDTVPVLAEGALVPLSRR